MSQAEYKVDRTGWPDGPWTTEPDKVQWHTRAGLPGLVVRNKHSGSLCGYAAVLPGHPLYEKPYQEVDGIDVHGGLTYSAFCMENGHICHVPEPGEPDKVWWLGFDCGHAWDVAPCMPGLLGLVNQNGDEWQYRDLEYVQDQVECLAAQLVVMGAPA